MKYQAEVVFGILVQVRCFMKYVFFLMLTLTGFAALPPYAQSAREIQKILSDSKTHAALGSAEAIQEIRKTDRGYLIITKNYELQVDIRYGGGPKLAGPVHFELEFHPVFNLRTAQVESR